MSSHSPSDSFVKELKRVLQSLYEWIEVYSSPLIEAFGLHRSEDSPAAVRRILADAIQSLKPNADAPSRTKDWRTYQLLYARYIEQFTQQEVANELGLSIRHLRREESQALQTLAIYLWHHYSLAQKWQEIQDDQRRPGGKANETNARVPTREQELKWLQESLPNERANVQNLVEDVLNLVHSIAHASQVHIDVVLADDLHHPVVKVTLVRQALLTILAGVIRSVPGGQISVTVGNEGSGICVLIQPEGQSPSGPIASTFEGLETAQQLIELSGGSLHVLASEAREGLRTIDVTLPAKEQVGVLVIDDNVDTLRLLRRYLSNSRYRFVGTSDPHQVLRLAEDSVPRIIVLDVMLPGIDGWELLGRLREHPQTRDTPIIVCTILPQEELALNLGAADFIRKPVRRAAFLAALDRQLAPPSKECS